MLVACSGPPDDPVASCMEGTITAATAVEGLTPARRHTPVCSHPGILRDGDFWPLSLAGVEQTDWVGLVALGGGRFVGALDSAVESPGWEVILVGSVDGGQTWTMLQTLRKPYYMATVTALVLDESGQGSLTVALEDDFGAGVAPGQYRSTLSEGGAVASPLQSL